MTERPVVQETTRMIRLRATHPAFHGRFTLLDAPDGELAMAWQADGARAELRADLREVTHRLTLSPAA